MRNFIKKLAVVLMMLPALALVSCDDGNEIPDVDVYVNIEGATRVGDTLYVVKGDVLNVKSITIVDNTDKGAVIGSANYFWDYYDLGGTIHPPYGIEIATANLPEGNHLLQIHMSIYAVDYPPCAGYVSYKVVIVGSNDDIPEDADTDVNPSIAAQIRSVDDDD